VRQSPCKWVSRDEEGRPSCEHGPAQKRGNGSYGCREKKRVNQLNYRQRTGYAVDKRYGQTEKGRERTRRRNASENAKLNKQWYELTRIR
jgi:hypothetical protein